ncbi:MAG: YjbQ family protein [Deltaproteobacteria bacterium]|nr:YjbQ family protein [Deltaproteobacteria bacterium]
MIQQETITLATSGHGDLHDLTAAVNSCLQQTAISTGTVNIFVIGSTAAIGTIEFEPGLQADLPQVLDRLLPPSRDYGHERTWHDGNGHSHLQATLLGPSLTVPVGNGRLRLGTWQQIFLLECDIKPRQRQVVVTISGE